MKPALRAPVVALVKLAVGVPAGALLLVLALWTRGVSARRRRAGTLPRLVWGPVPIISIKYWSEAMRAAGYESRTCVDSVFTINAAADFDRHRAEFGPKGVLGEPVRDVLVFAWALRHGDVFCFFFDGGFLRHTALRWVECRLLKLAGKRIVLSPYGSDIAVAGTLEVFEEAMTVDYPEMAERGPAIRRRVDHFARWGDVIVRNVQPGYLPRHDVVWPNQLAIDVEQWSPDGGHRGEDRSGGEVVVLHAPNHRALKGTDAVVRAVAELNDAGVPVRLDLLERRPNEEVRRALRDADVLAEQFLGGYGMLAVEGLACGTAVVSRLDWLPAELAEHPAVRACPIVNADRSTLRAVLERLANDPAERRRLGAAGREYALRYHSYAAIGAVWAQIFDAAWHDRPVDLEITRSA